MTNLDRLKNMNSEQAAKLIFQMICKYQTLEFKSVKDIELYLEKKTSFDTMYIYLCLNCYLCIFFLCVIKIIWRKIFTSSNYICM